jgi:hypothetical protein
LVTVGYANSAGTAGSAGSAGHAGWAYYLHTPITFTPAETALTPGNVFDLIGMGSQIRRGSWYYAGNGYIAKGNVAKDQCPFGAIDLAGTTVIQTSTANDQYTQIYITPSTSSTTNAIQGEMLYFINNGDSYAPTWYRVLTDKNYSSIIPTNTAGSTNTTNKIFLVGAMAQATNPTTYSNSAVYAQNGVLAATSIKVGEKVSAVYNASTESLDFIFN